MGEIWGQDIRLDASGQAVLAANGELALTDGVETGEQDVRLRLFTPLGSLFYDSDFGSLIHEWIRAEDTLASRIALEAEVIRRLREDARVIPSSAGCAVLAWDPKGVTLRLRWRFVDAAHPYDLVLALGPASTTLPLVLADVRPAADL